MTIFARLSKISRTRKLELFNKLMNPTKEMKILDIGAEINPTNENIIQFIDSYSWNNNVSAINLSSEHISLIKQYYPEVDARIRIYDRNVNLAKLTGANRDYILNHISHIAQLMTDKMEDVLDFGKTIVVGNNAKEFHGVLEKLKDDQVMVDFVRITGQTSEEGKYEGICW